MSLSGLVIWSFAKYYSPTGLTTRSCSYGQPERPEHDQSHIMMIRTKSPYLMYGSWRKRRKKSGPEMVTESLAANGQSIWIMVHYNNAHTNVYHSKAASFNKILIWPFLFRPNVHFNFATQRFLPISFALQLRITISPFVSLGP